MYPNQYNLRDALKDSKYLRGELQLIKRIHADDVAYLGCLEMTEELAIVIINSLIKDAMKEAVGLPDKNKEFYR